MKILEFIYNEKSISFDPTGNENVMVNATEMAKVFGKRIDVFLKADKTQEYIDALIDALNNGCEFTLNGGNSQQKNEAELPPNGGSSKVFTRNDIIKTVNGVNTWMHRFLALEFAGWMDAKFKVWVWSKIDQIILGHYREAKAATYEKLQAEKQRSKLIEELAKEADPRYLKVLELDGVISSSEKKRLSALRAASQQFKMDFFNQKTEANG